MWLKVFFSDLKYESYKEIVVIFDQACSSMLAFYDNVYSFHHV